MAVMVLLLMAVAPTISYAASNASSASSSSLASFTATPNIIFAKAAVTPTCNGGGFCPSMITKAYNLDPLFASGVNGTGQTVVIDDACGSPTIASDLKTFDSYFGLSNPTLNVYDPEGTPCNNPGWGYETSLDVEWSHVMAPGATIDLLQSAQPNGDLFDSWRYSLTNHLGSQISNSWEGEGACGVDKLVAKAAAENVTLLLAAGDGGWWGKGSGSKPASPGDCEGVLTVGGTSLYIKANGDYSSEAAWSGSGGGYVDHVAEPTYQSSVQINDSYGLLAKSDVSAVANPYTGVWIYDTNEGGWSVVGGTSVSTPLWAGFMADANQIRASHGFGGAGFVSPFLYDDIYGVGGSGTDYHADFHDVTTGSDGWPAGPGWDAPTGLGTFNAAHLAKAIGDSSSA